MVSAGHGILMAVKNALRQLMETWERVSKGVDRYFVLYDRCPSACRPFEFARGRRAVFVTWVGNMVGLEVDRGTRTQ